MSKGGQKYTLPLKNLSNTLPTINNLHHLLFNDRTNSLDKYLHVTY